MTASRTLRLAAIVALAAGFQACPPAKADDAATASNSHGRQLYMANNCYQCHGDVGQGGTGPTIAPPRLPRQTGFMSFVRNPSPPDMPPYTAKVLSDADLTAIWGYLASLPPPPDALPEPLQRLQGAKTP